MTNDNQGFAQKFLSGLGQLYTERYKLDSDPNAPLIDPCLLISVSGEVRKKPVDSFLKLPGGKEVLAMMISDLLIAEAVDWCALYTEAFVERSTKRVDIVPDSLNANEIDRAIVCILYEYEQVSVLLQRVKDGQLLGEINQDKYPIVTDPNFMATLNFAITGEEPAYAPVPVAANFMPGNETRH